jgi:hypothetical protein
MSQPVTGEVMPAAEVDDLDAAYAEVAREPYRFQWQGRQWELPHMAELDYRIQDEIENTESFDITAINKLFDRMFGADQAAAFQETRVTAPFLAMLFDRWLKHSGARPGESEASTGSSENTGGSSRPTSPASTGSGSPKRSTAKRAPGKAATRPGNSSA